MKRKVFFGVAIATTALVVGGTAFVNAKTTIPHVSATDNYVLTLDSDNSPSELTSSYQDNFQGRVSTTNGNEIAMNFVNAKALDGGFVELANHGKIYNFDASGNQLTSIDGISFSGTGSLLFKPVLVKSGKGAVLADLNPISVAPGSNVDVPTCDYFEIEAGDEGAKITSMVLSYTCNAADGSIKLINGTYTGLGDDTYTYKLVVTDGNVTIDSLDKQTNISLSGTVQPLSKTRFKCSFTYLTYNIFYTMDFNGHSFTFVEKSDEVGGAAASQIPEINFDKVYTVENFEQYTKTGTGYTSNDAKYLTTGLRANYYADYYTGSNSSPIGGSGWQIMTSSDNTNFESAKGHNASKGGIFKFSNGSSMRYINMNELYGVPTVIGKGTTLSFWARGAYTNANFNTNHTGNIPMTLYAFYDSPLTPSNQQTVRETFTFTVEAGSEWQHFEMPLTSGRNYYGFGIYAKQSTGSTAYVPFDDFEIYTTSPYATYTAPVAATGVSVDPATLEIEVGKTGNVTANIEPENATNKNVTFSSADDTVATVNATTGVVTGVAAGSTTITATTEDGNFTDTCAVTVVAAALMTRPEGTYVGTATVNGNDFTIVVALGNASNGLVSVKLANQDAEATSVSFDEGTNTLTIPTTGSYASSLSYGTISATYDAINDKLVNLGVNGSIKNYVSNNNSINCLKASANYYECDETTSELQTIFKRRWNNGSWQVDNSNADRLTSNTTEFVSGTGALKRRGYASGPVALNFNNDFSPTITVANVQFWVYNPSASDITLRMWYYTSANFATNGEIGTVTAKASGWTYCAMGFGSNKTIYNFQIADFNNTGTYLTFDNILFF